MPAVSSKTYLGDVISGDGSNKSNITKRITKGHGKIAQIISMIENISLGKHFCKIPILLRDTLFLSSLLTNSEVWYKITDGEIEELEMIDRTLLRRIFSVPNSTPIAGIYLEAGCMRIGTMIKARRINYLHYLAKLPQEEMLSKFSYHQWFVGGKYDWTTQVKNDLAELGLPENLEIIRKKSTLSWKTLVKKKAKEYKLENY